MCFAGIVSTARYYGDKGGDDNFSLNSSRFYLPVIRTFRAWIYLELWSRSINFVINGGIANGGRETKKELFILSSKFLFSLAYIINKHSDTLLSYFNIKLILTRFVSFEVKFKIFRLPAKNFLLEILSPYLLNPYNINYFRKIIREYPWLKKKKEKEDSKDIDGYNGIYKIPRSRLLFARFRA